VTDWPAPLPPAAAARPKPEIPRYRGIIVTPFNDQRNSPPGHPRCRDHFAWSRHAWTTRPRQATTSIPRGKTRSHATSPSSWPSPCRWPRRKSPGDKRTSSSTRNSRKVVQDAELGKGLLDRLVQVAGRDGGEQWVYIDIEVQGQHDANFPERLITYNYRLYDRYRRPVASLAVLADESDNRTPTHFGYQLFGCEVGIRFPSVKILDYADQAEALEADPNPFALVTAAHLFTRKTSGYPEQRHAAKWRLAKLLYERPWDKQRIIDLFSVIDWLMRLPTELEKRLMQEVYTLERKVTMPYVTSAERFGKKKWIAARQARRGGCASA